MPARRRYWLVVVPGERYAEERLYAHETVELAPAGPAAAARPGDDVALIAGDALIALGRVVGGEGGRLLVRYTRRLFDDPVAVAPNGPGTAVEPGELSGPAYQRLVAPAGRADPEPARWLVSIALPIEAGSAGEAVREFWTYVEKLGPRELPAYVWPRGDELAMQAFVLGAVTNLDPEEDDD